MQVPTMSNVSGRPYADVISDIQGDSAITDHYQAAHLITQAVNELCPASIRQLRNSAAHYIVVPTS